MESQKNFLVFFFLSLFNWSYPIQQSIFPLLFLLEKVLFLEKALTAFTNPSPFIYQALTLCYVLEIEMKRDVFLELKKLLTRKKSIQQITALKT